MDAITRSWAMLARDGADQGCADTATAPPSAEACRHTPSPQAGQAVSAADAEDLGREIAAAILGLVPTLVEEHGLIFEIADPEPVLRGIASAYAAVAHALPGGRDEAWTLWGLLALELDEDDRQAATS